MITLSRNRVVVASNNIGKWREFSRLLSPLGIQAVSQADFGIETPEETGSTFVENAIIKARHCASLSGCVVLADDSGICVDALKGAPGIYSARYAGERRNDCANNEKLLSTLLNTPLAERGATFVCVIVMMRSATDPQPAICEGRWRGWIDFEPHGFNGFGYDALFKVDGINLTAAQLEAEQKDALSHRGQATRSLLKRLSKEDFGVTDPS